jgi:hypothetical protein
MNNTSDYIRENNKSKQILSQTSDVQNAYSSLKELELKFSSILERYNTARHTLMNSTSTFIEDNSRIPAKSMLAKNIFVNKAVDNPQSEYIGIYNSNKNITHLDGDYSYMDCQVAAINNGNKFFTLSNFNSSANVGTCSTSNSISEIQTNGPPTEKCKMDNTDGKFYSNSLDANALYSTEGGSYNYVGCFNDDTKKYAMDESHTFKKYEIYDDFDIDIAKRTAGGAALTVNLHGDNRAKNENWNMIAAANGWEDFRRLHDCLGARGKHSIRWKA